MNPVPLFLIIVTLPLLLGGCNQSSSVLKYEIHGDSVTITGCDEDVLGELVIPDTIKGKPVTSIEGEAFFRCQSLTSITIPDGVTSIGFRAFNGCSKLKSITLPNSVISIGGSAFQACSRLTGITIPDSVNSIGDNAFSGCVGLKSITIPDSVTSIERETFMFCSSLTSITIGEGVTSIEHAAFIDCKSLTAVTFLGDSPTVGKGVFAGAPPTIYRKTEAKGWRDTFVGRPVKLISEKP